MGTVLLQENSFTKKTLGRAMTEDGQLGHDDDVEEPAVIAPTHVRQQRRLNSQHKTEATKFEVDRLAEALVKAATNVASEGPLAGAATMRTQEGSSPLQQLLLPGLMTIVALIAAVTAAVAAGMAIKAQREATKLALERESSAVKFCGILTSSDLTLGLPGECEALAEAEAKVKSTGIVGTATATQAGSPVSNTEELPEPDAECDIEAVPHDSGALMGACPAKCR